MIDHFMLPSWESIFIREGLKPLRRGRGPCPFCDSRTGFSCKDEKGFYCFACGVHGDKISFIQQFMQCDFRDALRYFGIEPGMPPAPDPGIQREYRILKGLKRRTHLLERFLRNDFLARQQYEFLGKKRLQNNPEDPAGAELLRIAYTGIALRVPLDEQERLLDLLIGREEQQLEAYMELKTRGIRWLLW